MHGGLTYSTSTWRYHHNPSSPTTTGLVDYIHILYSVTQGSTFDIVSLYRNYIDNFTTKHMEIFWDVPTKIIPCSNSFHVCHTSSSKSLPFIQVSLCWVVSSTVVTVCANVITIVIYISSSGENMESNHALATLRSYIIEDLNYKHVGDYLVKQGLISQKEDFEIFQLLGKSRNVKLLNLICTRWLISCFYFQENMSFYLFSFSTNSAKVVPLI